MTKEWWAWAFARDAIGTEGSKNWSSKADRAAASI